MSRRDIAVNALLGTFLLLVFFVCLSAIALVAWFGFIGLNWIFHLVVPGRTLPTRASLFVAWMLSSLWYVIRDLREKHWRNAFLFFISAPLIGLAWFTPFESSLGAKGNELAFWFTVIVIITIAGDKTLGWLKFSLAVALAGAAVLANSGLLGDGILAHTVGNCVVAVAIAWWVAAFRISQKTESLDGQLIFPPVGG
jgi:hypothetical protein